MPKKFIKSFKYAQAGVSHAVTTQRNMWIHIMAAASVLVLAGFFKPTFTEWAILVIVITVVIVVEMLNTALEELVNIVSPEHRPGAAVVKNVAAASVLMSAIGAVVVGILILLPKIL